MLHREPHGAQTVEARTTLLQESLQEIHLMVVPKAIAITVAALQQVAIVQRTVIQIVVLAALASGQTFAEYLYHNCHCPEF